MWQLRQPGPSRFEWLEVPAPTSGDLDDDEVLLQFLAGSMCGTDIPKFLGHVDPDNPYTGLPGVPLHEIVARVMASRSARLTDGQRVVGIAAQSRGLSEYLINPASFLVPVDDALGDVEATVVQPVSTVLSALSNVGDVRDRTVAVLGLGPLGVLFCRVAKACDAARIIGVDRVDRHDVAQIFGIDDVVVSETRSWAASLTEDQHRPDLVIDAIGHNDMVLADAVTAAAVGGELLVFGLPEDHYVFPMRAFFRKGLRMWAGVTRDWLRFLDLAQQFVMTHRKMTNAYLTHTLSISEALAAYTLYTTPAVGRLKIALTPPAVWPIPT